MSTNLATLIGGPCLASYKGSTFRSQADVTLNLALDTFDVVNDLYGAVDKRVAGQPIKLAFTPEGRFADLAVLFPHVGAAIGSLITPRWPCGAVNTGADTIAIANTSLAAGTPVSFGTTGTMPAGLTAATVYYLGANSGGARTIHTSAAAAIAGTGAIDLTSAGTGSLAFIETYELVILGNDGKQITFHNAAVTKMPAVNPASQKTLWGDVEFECFAKNGIPWTTADAFFTIADASFADSGFDPADIITQPYSLTWGSAPWAGIFTKNGFVIEPSLTLEAVEDDVSGILTRRISSLGFTAKAQPEGPDLSDVMAALKLQGAGATRGRSLAGPDLNIEGTGVYIRLYAAALSGGPAQWSSKLDRIGELTWQATRTFTDGVANPLFYIGAEAPA
jgi:hypothetical protein